MKMMPVILYAYRTGYWIGKQIKGVHYRLNSAFTHVFYGNMV